MLLEAISGEKQGKLEAQCDALVQLAEPGDAFSAFTASMNASAIASHIKSIESTFGLKVSSLSPKCKAVLQFGKQALLKGITNCLAVKRPKVTAVAVYLQSHLGKQP